MIYYKDEKGPYTHYGYDMWVRMYTYSGTPGIGWAWRARPTQGKRHLPGPAAAGCGGFKTEQEALSDAIKWAGKIKRA
jgi:hypothetical protein